MPDPTIDKCRQVLKRFAATLQKGISEEEKKKREGDLKLYMDLHKVQLKKL